MTTKPRFKSDAFAAIHSAALGLQRSGVGDRQTMREFDEMCLTEAPRFDAAAIARIRQASTSTVQKWESGAKQPSGIAARLLQVVQKHGLDVLT